MKPYVEIFSKTTLERLEESTFDHIMIQGGGIWGSK